MSGILYLVSTPIGNLQDITYRAVEILKNVSLISAEDTRHTSILLSHYDIHTPLTSYHEYNKDKKTGELIKRLLNGEDIAVVSDAGTPGISDPGCYLILEAIKNNIQVVPIPGASAFLSALIISGLPTHKFVFEGFLPIKKGKKTKYIEELKNEKRTIVLYESPHRLLKTLEDLYSILGDRNIAVARELTKKFEEVKRGKISEIITYFKENKEKIRGEFVIVVGGTNA